MLGKPRILSLFPNSFNTFNKNEHSCKILYVILGFAVLFTSTYNLFGRVFFYGYDHPVDGPVGIYHNCEGGIE